MAAGASSWSVCMVSMREGSLSDLDNSAAGGYAIWCGLDVGKSEHHVCALDSAGAKRHAHRLRHHRLVLDHQHPQRTSSRSAPPSDDHDGRSVNLA